MSKPKILVTSAAGHTGSIVVKELLEKGFPVRAFVRRIDSRAEALKKSGAEIFVGDLFDFRDIQKALKDVQRAYLCLPFNQNLLHGSMLFALAAEEAKLDTVVVLTAWNPHFAHPSIHQREHWLSNNILEWMPSVDVVYVNPGLFAFPYFFGVSAAANFGKLMLPFGDGLNAPPSNEDIALVASSILQNPSRHVGKSYRPTGPKLISGRDVATIFSDIFGRKVVYEDVPNWMFVKSAKAMGFKNFEIAQLRHYSEEVRKGTYEIGAPTDHVLRVTGKKAEDFEVTARRYIKNPGLVFPGLKVGGKFDASRLMLKTVLTPLPNLDKWESKMGYPILNNALLAHESEEWLINAHEKKISLLNTKNENVQSLAV